MIGPDIIVFSPNEVRSHFQICDHSIMTFRKTGLCLGFSNTFHVYSLERFGGLFVKKVKLDIDNLTKIEHSKEERELIMQMNSFTPWDWVILQHVLISLFLIKMTVITHILYNTF